MIWGAFGFPQKWYEVPRFVLDVWLTSWAEERRRAARAKEGPRKPGTRPRRDTHPARRAMLLDSLDRIRAQMEKMRPKKCCPGGIMTEGNGRKYETCSDGCEWSKLELLVATAMVDAEV